MSCPAGGIYHIIFRVSKDITLRVGAAGEFLFVRGWYVYTGTAQKSLGARLERHIRRDKKVRWHIDYLSTHPAASFAAAYFVEGEPRRAECRRNRRVVAGASFYIPKFGSSDCTSCPSHLAGFRKLSDFEELLGDDCVKYEPVSRC